MKRPAPLNDLCGEDFWGHCYIAEDPFDPRTGLGAITYRARLEIAARGSAPPVICRPPPAPAGSDNRRKPAPTIKRRINALS